MGSPCTVFQACRYVEPGVWVRVLWDGGSCKWAQECRERQTHHMVHVGKLVGEVSCHLQDLDHQQPPLAHSCGPIAGPTLALTDATSRPTPTLMWISCSPTPTLTWITCSPTPTLMWTTSSPHSCTHVDHQQPRLFPGSLGRAGLQAHLTLNPVMWVLGIDLRSMWKGLRGKWGKGPPPSPPIPRGLVPQHLVQL